mgnify:CR=1 FL=1
MDKIKKGVRLDHISKIYQDPKTGKDFYAVKDTSLTIEPGSFVTLLGPSGCGKTTTLRMIAGFESPDEGEIYLGDEPINALTPNKRDTAMVFQSYALLPHYNVFDNVAYGLKLRKVPKDEIRERVMHILDLVELTGMEGRMTNQLSGGQQQRVALARILCSEPEAILLDEPFSALDSYLKWNLEIELADLLATFNGPILWVSHDRDECYRNCRSVCVMEDGRTGEVTPMDEMIRHPGSVSAARLAGCKNFFAAEARDGKVYLPEWNVALPLAGMENTFTTIGIPDNAVTMSENGAMSCTVCRMILGVEENILLLRPEGSAEGAPMLRITVGHESDLQAGAAVRVALDYSKLLLL